MATEAAYVDFEEGSAPATPGTGIRRVYALTTGMAEKDDAGSETGWGGGASAIDDLSDVDTDKSKTPADGDVLTYDGTDWNAETPSGASLGAWTTAVPTWGKASGTAPAIGNGTLTGRYKALDANTYAWHMFIQMGSTTTYGSDGSAFTFTLPFTTASGVGQQVVAGQILDSGVDNKLAAAVISAGAAIISGVTAEGTNACTPTTPMTWGAGDNLTLSGIIEV